MYEKKVQLARQRDGGATTEDETMRIVASSSVDGKVLDWFIKTAPSRGDWARALWDKRKIGNIQYPFNKRTYTVTRDTKTNTLTLEEVTE